MRGLHNEGLRPNRLSYAVSLALASIMAGNVAHAQEAAPAVKKTGTDEIAKVMVVGARASQQSAIDRKKNAATAVDSIIAEDVGAFPDRNVGEAISRISGIALDRGDFGEGVNIAVRGNGPDLTRVEIDGMGVQAGGGTDLNQGGGGRGVELRELSSDLIKSVDVVKGSTADMTEGSLGGGIIIKTKTGLDFDKRFMSARVAAGQNSLNKEWKPDLNFIFADKFLDNQLGVVVNLSKSKAANEGHSSAISTSSSAGYARVLDFDNSPEKTFSFNPELVDPTATAPMLRSPMVGGGFFDAASPLDLVRRSGAAASKADCYTAFPNLNQAQLDSIAAGSRNAAVAHRGNELLTCLNQWNDYTPSLIRYLVKRQDDSRTSGDIRFDFKVNNKLTVYAKYNRGSRTVIDNFLTYSLGGLNVNPGAVVTAQNTVVPAYSDATGTRVANPGTGYMTFPTTASSRANAYPIPGAIANVIPGSYQVDKNHHVTRFGITDGGAGTDQIYNRIKTESTYTQAGGTWRDGPFKAEFLIGDARSKFQRGDMRTSWFATYGQSTLALADNGLWTYEFPATSTFNQADAALYAVVRPASGPRAPVAASVNGPATPAYTVAQQPLQTQSINAQWTPRMSESNEKTAKLDLSYALSESVPWFQNVKTGFNLRQNSGTNYTDGVGYTVKGAQGTFGQPGFVPPVVVPHARLRGNIIGCTDTPGSLGPGGAPCQFGYVPRTGLSDTRFGTSTLTQAQFQDMIAQSMQKGPWSQFFGGAKDRPANMINGWNQIDVPKVFELAGVQNANFDCVKECMANDGKVYPGQYSSYSEKTYAGYLMSEFDLTRLPFSEKSWLPFGMELNGNFGYRYVYTKVSGRGLMSFTSIVRTASFDPLNPDAAGGSVSTTIMQPTELNKSTTDIMPVFNLALWVVPDTVVVRYNRAKTIARPPINLLMPSGSCTFDERREAYVSSTGDELDQNCTGTVGNPALKPWANYNQNLSAEWYVNKDTMFTAAVFKQKGVVGPATRVGRSDNLLFAGGNTVDPITGKNLSDVNFAYSTWENGPATTRTGFEAGIKTAFTSLPWLLRYTGLDANYTKVKSTNNTMTVRDLITGETLAPAGEPKHSYNASLWYDDGAFSARIALQAVAERFICIASCYNANAVNNFPAPGAGSRIGTLPFNPGSPNFRDATKYIDVKMAYKFNNGVELFAEARNLTKETTSQSQGNFVRFENGTPSMHDIAYAGRRLMVGANFRH